MLRHADVEIAVTMVFFPDAYRKPGLDHYAYFNDYYSPYSAESAITTIGFLLS
jgi:hypothetical protein